MIDLQFYPTPIELAKRAWSKFKNKQVIRLLEPSAGEGAMLEPEFDSFEEKPHFAWDAIEMDATKHPLLRTRGATVVGYDFLQHTSCSIYSHILMNPPFAQGAQHVLHAWRTLFEGEIVAIINAETLRNPFSAERKMLARLVAEHGSVEFISNAFKGEGVERETGVEIALIHLEKMAESDNILGDLLGDLAREQDSADELKWKSPSELALPEGFVELTVRHFDAAVVAAKESAIAEAKAAHYAARLGETMEMLQSKEQDANKRKRVSPGEMARDTFASAYAGLKNRAWTQILRSTHVLSRLSSKSQKRVESEFENIKGLEFTVRNVYGFLEGLVLAQGDIQLKMMCEVFDSVARHHSDNTVFYMGWKSNDKHRTAGMRIKRTRFIIPGHTGESWRQQADYETRRFLSDFDKVFSMLDGKSEPALSLEALFANPQTYSRLCNGERLATDYFEIRYYRQRGTIHFFPTKMDVVDRLNRVVGQYRKWLPPEADFTGDFKKQYDHAEKLNAEVMQELANREGRRPACQRATLSALFWGEGRGAEDEKEISHANNLMSEVLETVLDKHGIHPFEQLEGQRPQQLLLNAA